MEIEELVEEDTQPHAIHLNSLVIMFEKRWIRNRPVNEGVTEKSEDDAEEAVAVVVNQPIRPQMSVWE